MNEALPCRNLCVHVFIHQAIVTAVLHRAVQRRVTMEFSLTSPLEQRQAAEHSTAAANEHDVGLGCLSLTA